MAIRVHIYRVFKDPISICISDRLGIASTEADDSTFLPRKTKGATVIRQVITCDICGSQKHQTNHWFVAYEESGELRINGWNSLHLLSSGTKHLCGETCAHKLISHFLMRLVDVGPQQSGQKGDAGPVDFAVLAPKPMRLD
jgi:hypothetical protein